jgi:hypothetical protein
MNSSADRISTWSHGVRRPEHGQISSAKAAGWLHPGVHAARRDLAAAEGRPPRGCTRAAYPGNVLVSDDLWLDNPAEKDLLAILGVLGVPDDEAWPASWTHPSQISGGRS